MYEDALTAGILPPSLREAIIVVLPKPDKDPCMPDSYRPISLLTSDVKLLARVLANRLSRVISGLIHPDQSGFMPDRSTSLNLRRLHLNLQAYRGGGGGRAAIVSLDAAKAFDSVEWEYLWAVMRRMGFGPTFLRWVRLLYTQPRARVRTNGRLSGGFGLGRGTRQGCPLSPLLFAIAIEPLASLLRSSPGFRGFPWRGGEEKVSLYADDMLLYTSDYDSSIGPVMSLITDFGRYSGLTINWSKSVVMLLSPGADPDPLPPTSLRLVDRFRYLGIEVTANVRDFVSDNLLPLLRRFQGKVDVWSRLPLSVVGRCNLIKMILMPQLLYVLHNSPVWIPALHFKRVNSLFRSLIWRGGSARIKLDTLQRSKFNGGLAVPNPYMYFLASQLQHLKGWGLAGDVGISGRLFGEITGFLPPVCALEVGSIMGPARLLPTVSMMLRVWTAVKSLLGVSGHTPFTPLWGNPCLPEVFRLEGFSPWARLGVRLLADVVKDDTVLSFADLQTTHDLPHRFFYQYLQLRHALQARRVGGSLSVSCHDLLGEVGKGGSRSGLISRAYSVLLDRHHASHSLGARTKWEREVGPLTDEQWTDLLGEVPLLSLSEAHRLSQLYLIHRVYRTPQFLYRIGWRTDSACPRCAEEGADILHMFWGCRELGGYWTGILDLIRSIYAVSLPRTPAVCVLGCVDPDLLEGAASLGIGRILYQARKTIASRWTDAVPPTLQEFIGRMNAVIRLERGVYFKRKAGAKFEKIWGRWLDTPGLPTPILTQLCRPFG